MIRFRYDRRRFPDRPEENFTIEKFGAETMVVRAASVFVVASAVGLVGTLASDGVPSVWFWFGWALVANAMGIVMGPMSASLALEPMADKAGTAAAILGVAQLGVGAALAALIDAQIDTTVTPMVLGSLVYGALGLSCLLLALRPWERRSMPSGSSVQRPAAAVVAD